MKRLLSIHWQILVIIKGYFTTTITVATAVGRSPEALALVLIDFHFFDIDFFAIDGLFGRLEQLVNNIFGVECHETVASALIFRLVEWGLHFDNGTMLTKIVSDVLICNLGCETTNKYFTMLGLLAHTLGVDL